MNCTANPEGLTPMLLMFGSVPKISLGNIEHLAPNQRTRFAAVDASRKEMERIVAEQRLKLACKLRTKGMDVFSICTESKLLVYPEKLKKWDGPFTLHKYNNYKTAYVKVGNSIEPFSITAVNPYRSEIEKNFHEDSSIAGVGDRVEVYCSKDEEYYPGTISRFDAKSGKHLVGYDDGDVEDLLFATEKWKIISNRANYGEVCPESEKLAEFTPNLVNEVIVKIQWTIDLLSLLEMKSKAFWREDHMWL